MWVEHGHFLAILIMLCGSCICMDFNNKLQYMSQYCISYGVFWSLAPLSPLKSSVRVLSLIFVVEDLTEEKHLIVAPGVCISFVLQITASAKFGDYHRLLAPGEVYEG